MIIFEHCPFHKGVGILETRFIKTVFTAQILLKNWTLLYELSLRIAQGVLASFFFLLCFSSTLHSGFSPLCPALCMDLCSKNFPDYGELRKDRSLSHGEIFHMSGSVNRSAIPKVRSHERTPRESYFFKNIKLLRLVRQIGQKNAGAFWVFSDKLQYLSWHCESKVHGFEYLVCFFTKNFGFQA